MGRIQAQISARINELVQGRQRVAKIDSSNSEVSLANYARIVLEILMFYFETPSDFVAARDDSIYPISDPQRVSGTIQWFEEKKKYLYDIATVGYLDLLSFTNIQLQDTLVLRQQYPDDFLGRLDDQTRKEKLGTTGHVFAANYDRMLAEDHEIGSGVALLVNDVQRDVFYYNGFHIPIRDIDISAYEDLPDGNREFTQSMLVVPLIYGNAPVGIILIESLEPNYFKEGDLDFLQSVAFRISVMLKTAESMEQSRQYNLAQNLVERIQQETNFENFVKATVQQIKQYIEGRIPDANIKASIWLVENDEHHIAVRGSDSYDIIGSKKLTIKAYGDNLTGHVIATKEYAFAENLNDKKWDGRIAYIYEDDWQPLSEIVVPFFETSNSDQDAKVVGVINLQSDKLRLFRHEDEYFLSRLGSHLVTARKIIDLRDRLNRLNAQDTFGYITQFIQHVHHQTGNTMMAVGTSIDRAQIILEEDLDHVPDDVHNLLERALNSFKKFEGEFKSWHKRFSQFETVTLRAFHVREELEAAAGAVQREASESSNVRVDIQMPHHSNEIIVQGDDALSGILKEIFNNAVKYRHPGRDIVQVDVSVTSDDSTVEIRIQDNGRGLRQGDLDDIFRPDVYQVGLTQAEKENIVSSGIGLFYSRIVITTLGGTIHAESDGLNKGTTFVIKLPISELAQE